jgi:hypothetical protein
MIHLPTQKTQTYCSIASSVMVLNALAADRAPIDPEYGELWRYFFLSEHLSFAWNVALSKQSNCCVIVMPPLLSDWPPMTQPLLRP